MRGGMSYSSQADGPYGCWGCSVCVVDGREYLSNQCFKYACVLRKFDGVRDVPCHSLLKRTIAVGTFNNFNAL